MLYYNINTLRGKMKILVPLAEGFEEIEATTIIDVLRRAGLKVVTAGLSGITVKGSSGVKIIADAELKNINSDEFAVIVLPGGYPGYINLAESEKVLKIIKEFNSQNKMVAAICGAPTVLAKAGILNNRNATVYPGLEKELPNPTDKKVVVDGNIITSQGPGTAIEFALKLVEILSGEDKAKEIKEQLLFKD